MAQTASDVLMDTLHDCGVDVIFGLPGDGINGMMEALRQRQDKIRFIHVRHEEAAAFMACAYAKHTGKLGCCIATSGPGALHLMNGLYDAKLDAQPVIALTGMQFHDLTNTHQQQDLEIDRVMMDLSVYNVRIMGAAHVEPATELACRKAMSLRGVSHITIPVDFQEMPVNKDKRSGRNVPHHAATETLGMSAQVPPRAALAKAAEVLSSGKRVAILAGRGAIDATDELEFIAEKLAAPIVKALLGKAAVPDDSPFTTGSIGLLGTKPSDEVMENCDALLIVGSSFPYIDFLPKPGQARAVQIDIAPDRIGLRYPVEIGLVGDSKQTLAALLPLLTRNSDRHFLEETQAGMRDWWSRMDKYAAREDKPLKPQVVARAIGDRLSDTAIVNCDSGTIATWWARQIKVKRGQKHTISGNLATMACGLPYTIASQVAFPDRQCVGFVGDGGFTMLMGEIATAVKYQLPIKIFVIKNDTLGQIKWEQMVMLGNPEFGCDLNPNIDFVKFAEACGARGFRIEDPRECGNLVDEALAHPGPVVVECIVDPNEPPMPGKVSADQALKFAEAMARGTKDRGKILATIMGDKARELV
ncbi:MAG TPA: thiamine pyrophosphate-dependent enzyme [Bryobacteraceae bacterium]|nr:thiamine pyrophosphate-dependent enzyme [Bryobacteraceae bacterium]